MSESTLIKINEYISYLPASEQPLSCDIVFIKTDACTWIFDVGMCSQAAEEIKKIEGKKNIVISHFHPDHILNLPRVSYDELYVSSNTKKYTFKGTVVSGQMSFTGVPEVKIVELPSSHAKGCLCLLCGEYAFMGDGTYCKPIKGHHFYNAQLLQEMIKVMEGLEVKYFCLSHEKNFIQNKDAVIALYKDIYSRREPNNPRINVEDYFNADGSVKE